jgi:hypothetical protein
MVWVYESIFRESKKLLEALRVPQFAIVSFDVVLIRCCSNLARESHLYQHGVSALGSHKPPIHS